MDDPALPEDLVGTTGTRTFAVDPDQTTAVFGRQETPPGNPAAADASPAEVVRVLGTAPLLSQVEFAGRESLAGEIPAGTGLVGKRASVSHTSPATVGTRVRVRTEVADVQGPAVTYDGQIQAVESGRSVAAAEVVLRLVDRDRFRAAVDAADSGDGYDRS